jgi:hypothetical protein
MASLWERVTSTVGTFENEHQKSKNRVGKDQKYTMFAGRSLQGKAQYVKEMS